MTGRLAAGWDRIDARPRHYVIAIGRDRKLRIHDCDDCDVTQCKLARTLHDKGEWVRMIDVGQYGYVTMIRCNADVKYQAQRKAERAKEQPSPQETTPNVQNNQT